MSTRNNVVVEAGAGTGKTSLLIRVFLDRVLGSPGLAPIPIERIVALTFTKKAAGEIKERLFKSLSEQASLGSSEAERGRVRAALQNIDKASIDTIHGFASSLLRLYPLESGLSPDFEIDEGALIEEVFEEEWLRWLDVELGDRAPRSELWISLLQKTDLGQIKKLAKAVISERLGDESLARPCRAVLQAVSEMGESAASLGISPEGEDVVGRALRLLLPFREAMRARLSEKGLISFDGLLMRARNLLRDHPKVRDELKGRYDTFLVDEFQDTDPLQGEILFFLAEERGGAGASGALDWERIRLGRGRLFVVGDPKQSIYRFRGADIAAYQRFTRRILEQEGRSTDLEINYRSPADMLGAVNAVFAGLMAEKEGLQAPYKALKPRPGGETAPTGRAPVEIAVADAAKAGEGLRLQAAFVAGWIARHCGPGRERRYKDAAVLLRSATALPDFCQALRKSGIPYVSDGEKSFFSAPEAGDMINLVRAARDPSDRSALAGILRSPLVCMEDGDLLRLARAGELDYLKDASRATLKSGREAVLCLFKILRRIHSMSGRVSLFELLCDLFESLSVRELLSAAYGGQQTAANLAKLLRMSEEFTGDLSKGPEEFAAYLARSRKEGRAEGESPLSDDRFDAVRLLTIHKAKRLEFPVVFLANLPAKAAPPNSGPSVLYDWETGAAGFRIKGKRGTGMADIAMAYLAPREKAREDEEQIRLLYVAMTRAREKLFLLGRTKISPGSLAALLKKGGTWPGEGSSLEIGGVSIPVRVLAEGERPFEEIESLAGEAPPSSLPAPERFSKLWLARREKKAAAAPEQIIFPSRESEFLDADASLPGLEGGGPGPSSSSAFVGRICHKVLESWVFREFWSEADLEAAMGPAVGELSASEPQGLWAEAEAEARGVLSRFLSSPRARGMSRVKILGRETPFSYKKDGRLVSGVIDLIYEDQGAVVVADYKSDKADSPAQWARLREKYARQGALYLEAVERAWGRKPDRFEVVFLRGAEREAPEAA